MRNGKLWRPLKGMSNYIYTCPDCDLATEHVAVKELKCPDCEAVMVKGDVAPVKKPSYNDIVFSTDIHYKWITWDAQYVTMTTATGTTTDPAGTNEAFFGGRTIREGRTIRNPWTEDDDDVDADDD